MKVKKILTGLLFLSFVAIGSQSCQKTEEDDDSQSTEQPAEITETAFGLNMKLVKINGGTFQMGSDIHSNETPIHTVTLSAFYIGKYEITRAQWQAVMGYDPSYFSDCDDCPVERVSWYDVKSFLQKLNQLSGRNYTLPTEAQWEYTAGGGAIERTIWAGTDVESSLGSFAWYDGNSNSRTHSIGTKSPNALGIFDMSGNVFEWCEDDWHRYYSGAPGNGSAWVDSPRGAYRIYRGGYWLGEPASSRVAFRMCRPPDFIGGVGFRVALIP